MEARRRRPLPWLNPGIFMGAMAPAVTILMRARSGALGANPIAEALNELGLIALVLLIASLACTPLKTLLGWTWPMRARRLIGLLAFTYAALHLTVYAGLDQGLDFRAVLADVVKRRFIFVGFAAFVMMIPLALTSTGASVRRMGYVKWKQLHLLVYPAALCAVIHFVWRVKKDLREPLVYAAILGALLLVRVIAARRRSRPAAATSGPNA
ncbi:MAG TPA: protein-methionine-sulfoxide reductase heme-binding subunit MsrQ [Vicinamibacteria bacterium]|nr:protein-methionine-sulfoxide reductase heme-binding subunit MsrQ [Vicinamibacteria bacterium]